MAIERACSVFVQANYIDAPAIALYGKFGVRQDVLHFESRLPQDARPQGRRSPAFLAEVISPSVPAA